MSLSLLADNGAVQVLLFLLPGFVAAALYYSLTSHPRPNQFGQVVHALVFTMVGQLAAWLVVDRLRWVGGDWGVGLSVVGAVVFALVVVGVSNNDLAHRIFKWMRVTRENSYSSEWYSAFAQNSDCYVVLHLTDNRQLFGWPSEWSSDPDKGHIRITEGEWLGDSGISPETETSRETRAYLISVKDVEMVEFIEGELMV